MVFKRLLYILTLPFLLLIPPLAWVALKYNYRQPDSYEKRRHIKDAKWCLSYKRVFKQWLIEFKG